VLTQNQLGHVIEASIWTLTAVHMWICAYRYHETVYWIEGPDDATAQDEEQKEKLITFVKYFMVLAFFYIRMRFIFS
jgi:hypothetical protein